MHELTYEPWTHYIFDRGYNDFGNLHTINRIGNSSLYESQTTYGLSPKPGNEEIAGRYC